MRMWMVRPRILCRKHLLGEHVELHMFVGTINRGINISGYVNDNLCEPRSIKKRHAALAREMLRRGYRHTSPLPRYSQKRLPAAFLCVRVDVIRSTEDLLARCPECRANAQRLSLS